MISIHFVYLAKINFTSFFKYSSTVNSFRNVLLLIHSFLFGFALVIFSLHYFYRYKIFKLHLNNMSLLIFQLQMYHPNVLAGNTGKNHRDGAKKKKTEPNSKLKVVTMLNETQLQDVLWIKRLLVGNLKVFVQKSRELFYLMSTN